MVYFCYYKSFLPFHDLTKIYIIMLYQSRNKGTSTLHSLCSTFISTSGFVRRIWVCSVILSAHKVLTYVEYRAVSGVFQNIDPPPPLPLTSESCPPHQRRGGTHPPGGEGVGGLTVSLIPSTGIPVFQPGGPVRHCPGLNSCHY